MKARLPVILIGTRLLALGAGWWRLLPSDPEPGVDEELPRTSKSELPARQERRVSKEDLLAACRFDSDQWSAAVKRRREAAPVQEARPNASSFAADLPVEKRAAAIAEIPGTM